MKDSVAMSMFVVGLVLTLFGLCGIEASMDIGASMDAVSHAQHLAVAVVGLMTTVVALLAIRINSSTDYYK